MVVALKRHAGPGLTLELYDAVGPLADEWDALADRTAATPFVRPGWMAAWYQAFPKAAPLVAGLRRDGVLAAVAALESRRSVIRSATNWHSPLYDLVADGDEAANALAHAILALRPRRVELRFVAAGSLAFTAFRAAAEACRYRIVSRTLQESPYVTTSGRWGAYAATRSQTMLKELARRQRALERAGSVAFTVERGDGNVDDALATGFRIEGSGWKARAGTAIVSRPETAEFYTAVAHWAAERGWLRLAFLEHQGRPIAFQLDVEADGVVYHLKPGYDETYGRFRPGKLLTEHVLRSSFEQGLRSYEFLGAADAHKLEWARDVRERLLLQAFAPTRAGLAELAAFRYGRPAAVRALAGVAQVRRFLRARTGR